MPSPRQVIAVYKAGQNIWLRWSPKVARLYRDKFAATERGESLGYITKITGFSPRVLDKMAENRLLMIGNSGFKDLKNATNFEKAINNMHRGADWSEYILPEGARGYKGWGKYGKGMKIPKSRVPYSYELDDMKNLYFKTGSKAVKKATDKRFFDAYLVPKGQRARYSRTGSGRINDRNVPK